MEIRPARAADGPDLLRLERQAWEWFVGPQPPGDGSFFARSDPDDFLVAEADGRCAGYVKLGHRTELANNRHVLEIRGLAVDPAYARQGVGRTLLESAIGEARRRGAAKLGLRVFEPNAAARALYERCGFEVVGVLRDEFRIDGRSIDDLIMELRLV